MLINLQLLINCYVCIYFITNQKQNIYYTSTLNLLRIDQLTSCKLMQLVLEIESYDY